MLEKPMAVDEDSARQVVADAERGGLLLAVGLVERCNPAVVALRMMLEEGTAGQDPPGPRPTPEPLPGSRVAGRRRARSCHSRSRRDPLCHAAARSTACLPRPPPAPERRARTSSSATLRLATGAIGMVDVNWLTPTKVRQLSVTCEGGMFIVDYLTQDLTFYQHPRSDIEWDILRMMRGTGEGDMVRYGIARREPLARAVGPVPRRAWRVMASPLPAARTASPRSRSRWRSSGRDPDQLEPSYAPRVP